MRVGSYGGIGLKAVGVARSSVLTSEETVKICERGRDRKKTKDKRERKNFKSYKENQIYKPSLNRKLLDRLP